MTIKGDPRVPRGWAAFLRLLLRLAELRATPGKHGKSLSPNGMSRKAVAPPHTDCELAAGAEKQSRPARSRVISFWGLDRNGTQSGYQRTS